MKRPLVLTTWHDSRQPTASWAWLPPKEVAVVVVQTVGWVVWKSPEVTAVAASIGDAGTDQEQANGIMQIATRAILSTRVLKA